MELDKDTQIELAVLQSLGKEVDLTAAQQIPLGVSPEYARRNYDSQAAHRAFHDSQFGDKKVITGPNGEILHRSQAAAQNKYGKRQASRHQAQADHIDPIKNVYDRWKDNPFLKDEDIKEVVNRMKNFQERSRHDNASKGATSGVQEGIQSRDIGEVFNGLKAQTETDILLTGHAAKNAAGAVADIVKSKSGEAIQAGKETALIALTISGLHNLADLASGEKDLETALKDVALDTASSFASGTGLRMTQEVVAGVAHIVGADHVVDFVAGGFPVAEVAAAAMTARCVIQYLDGEISGEDCAVQILVSGAGVLAYQLGTLVGGPAGAVVASIIVTQVTNTILEYRQEKKIQRARDAEISRVLSHAMAEISRQRDLLDGYVKEELKRWDDTVNVGFGIILQSAADQNIDGIAMGLNTILALFNTQVLYPSLADFDRDFYDLDAPPLIL